MSINNSKGPKHKQKKIFPGWRVLFANCVVMAFSSGVTNYGATIFFNPVSSTLGISRTATSIAISISRAENSLLGPINGYFIDRFGPRGPIYVGMTLMSFGLIIFGLFANNLFMFVLTWTFLVSLGANIGGFAPNWATINNWFVRKKGKAMGIGMASQATGGVVLAPLLAFTIANWGWRIGAISTGTAVILLVLPVIGLIRTRPQDMGLQPDGDAPNATSNMQAMDGSYSIREATKTATFWILTGAIALRQMGQAGIMLHLSPLLQDRYGFGPVQAGGLIGILALIGAIGAITAGVSSDHFQRRRVMGTVVALEAISLALLAMGNTELVYAFVAIFGFGQGAHALNRAILGEYFGTSHYGRLWGIISMLITPMAAIGPIYAGWVSEAGGYGSAIVTFMVTYSIAAFLYWNCRPPSRRMPSS